MRRTYWTLFLATTIAAAGVLTAACGDDDTGAGGTDSGLETTPPTPPPPNPPPPPPGPDGGDAGCTFATYVIGLITNSTTASAKPDPSLGAGCKDTTTQAEFKPLFP